MSSQLQLGMAISMSAAFPLCLSGVVLTLDGNGVELVYDDLDTDSASLTVDGVDNLYELGFYYIRGNGNIEKLQGGTLIDADTIRYNPQNNIFVDVQFGLPTTAFPDLDVSVTIQNDRNRTINRGVIFYFDYDLNGGFQNHTANAFGNTIAVSEPGGVSASVTGAGADFLEVGEFSSLRTSIEAGNQLANSNLSLTNGDFAGAFQWNFSIDSGASVTAEKLAVIPEPSVSGLLAGVFAGVSSLFRRRRFAEAA